MADILDFVTRPTYNEQRYVELTTEQREIAFQQRATDTIVNLGRFLKSTGYLDEKAEQEFLQLSSSIISFSKQLAGAPYHGTERGRDTSEARSGKTTEESNQSTPTEPNSNQEA